MRRLLLAAFLLLCSTAAHAQSATPLSTCWAAAPGSSGSQGCTLTATAHTVLAVGAWFYGGPTGSPISDTLGLSWTLAAGCNAFRAGSRNDQLELFYADTGSSSGSDTITINNISSNFELISAADFNTGEASPTADVAFGCNGGTTTNPNTTISSMSGTLTYTNELVIGFGETANPGTAAQMGISPGAGFSNSITAPAPNFAPNYAQGSTIGSLITPMEAIIEPSSGSFAVTYDQTVAGFYFVVGVSFQTTITPPPPATFPRHKVSLY